MANFTSFKGVENLGETQITQTIKKNLHHFLDWGFAGIGAYYNVEIPRSGHYGGDESRLRPVDSPYYTDGQVWEAFRGNWMWESGVDKSPAPIQVSGVFVDGVFNQLGSGNHVDYKNGRVVFDTAISTTSEVRIEYSYRWVNVYDADDIPEFKQLQYNSQRIETSQFLNMGSGDRSQLSSTKVQYPAVIMEVADGDYEPFQLGLGQYSYNDVVLHVMGDKYSVDQIADVLGAQKGKTIFLFDVDLAADSGVFPLNYQGSISANALTYPDLVKAQEDNGYRWRKMRFTESRKQKTTEINQNLHQKPVRLTTEVVLTNI